jgi:hypothetical protein
MSRAARDAGTVGNFEKPTARPDCRVARCSDPAAGSRWEREAHGKCKTQEVFCLSSCTLRTLRFLRSGLLALRSLATVFRGSR